jgi:hypothetical protein
MSPFLMYWHILQVNFYRNIMFLLFCIFCHMHFWNLYLYLSNKTFNFFGVILHFILLLKNEPFKTKNWTTCITILCVTRTIFPKYYAYFVYTHWSPLFHWKSKTVRYHKIEGPCFIIDNLNEWIHHWLSLWRFNITWAPSLFLMGLGVVYPTLLLWLVHFQ